MGERPSCGIITTTCSSRTEADALAQGLVRARLAACVQRISISSVFSWQEKLQVEDELLLLIKAPVANYHAIEAYICRHHSYEVPEILLVPVQAGLRAYMDWINDVAGTAESPGQESNP